MDSLTPGVHNEDLSERSGPKIVVSTRQGSIASLRGRTRLYRRLWLICSSRARISPDGFFDTWRS